MRKKLQPWKGKHLSSGGRFILTNSSLSSIPTYLMGIYLLHEGTHKAMDTIRSSFFWRGDSDRAKYHMIKWENVCLPKDFGGLGIINTWVMNESLLLKWVWRLLQNSRDDKCCQLLRAKYLQRKPIMLCRGGWILVLERDKQDQAQHKLGGLLSQLTTGGVSDFGKMCGFWIFP